MELMEDYFRFHKKKFRPQTLSTSLAETGKHPPQVPSLHFVKGFALIKEGETPRTHTTHLFKSPLWSKASHDEDSGIEKLRRKDKNLKRQRLEY